MVSWTQLFKRLRFFARYEHFIKFDILSQTHEERVKWQSYMDTKMKNLCDLIFNEFSEQLVELRMHPRPFSREETCDTLNMDWNFCESYFIGLKWSRNSDSKPIDLRHAVQIFCASIDMYRLNKQDSNCRIMHYLRD